MITVGLIITLFFVQLPHVAAADLCDPRAYHGGALVARVRAGHGGSLQHSFSIAVIPMVLGIGIDFGIQILGRYEEELGHGRTIQEAVTDALQHTGVAIITGGSTTAAAFFTLCFNDFVTAWPSWVSSPARSMVFCITAEPRRAARRLHSARSPPRPTRNSRPI